jgi:hypothetical protein
VGTPVAPASPPLDEEVGPASKGTFATMSLGELPHATTRRATAAGKRNEISLGRGLRGILVRRQSLGGFMGHL